MTQRIHLWNGDFSLEELERLLDAGNLQVRCMNERWYQIRRNGRTRQWRDGRYRIPYKFGHYNYGALDSTIHDEIRAVNQGLPEELAP